MANKLLWLNQLFSNISACVATPVNQWAKKVFVVVVAVVVVVVLGVQR